MLWAGKGHLGLLLDSEGGGGEGVALAVAQLALLRAVAQNVINVLRKHNAHMSPAIPASSPLHACLLVN